VWWIGVYDAAAASSAIISAARLSGVSNSERGRLLELVERSDLVGEGGGGGTFSRGRGGEGRVAAEAVPVAAPMDWAEDGAVRFWGGLGVRFGVTRLR
jgi:hypothetical protein